MGHKEPIRITCQGADTVQLNELIEMQGGLKELSEKAFDKLKAEILSLGFTAPFFVWRSPESDLRVLDGHQRLRVLRRLQQEGHAVPPVPVVWVDAADENAAKRKILSFVSQYGRITDEGLYEFLHTAEMDLSSLQNFDVPGFDLKDFTENFFGKPQDNSNKDEDAVPVAVEAIAKTGNMWALGDHRLLCGDSTDIENVRRLMGGMKARVVFTDPPYNLQERGLQKRTNKGGSASREDFGIWDDGFDPVSSTPSIVSAVADNAHIFICTSGFLFGTFTKLLEDAGARVNYLVWTKRNPMPSLHKTSFVQATELIVYARMGSPEFMYPSGENLRNIIDGNVEAHTSGHPTQKPVYVPKYCIEPASNRGDIVLDLFGGSGSTLIACHSLERRCFMVELDPHYCDVIVKRWEEFTGQKAELLST